MDAKDWRVREDDDDRWALVEGPREAETVYAYFFDKELAERVAWLLRREEGDR